MSFICGVMVFYLYFGNMKPTNLDLAVILESHQKGDCVRKCNTMNINCHSFFFDSTDKQCILYVGTVRPNDTGLVVKSDVLYYISEAARTCLDHPGFRYEGPGLCLKYFISAATWPTARSTCEAEGASLVKIDSEDKNNFLKYAYAPKGKFWLGGNDISTEGTWVWTDGTWIQGYLDWYGAEPDGGTNQNCMTLMTYGWRNGGCTDQTNPFLCEIYAA